MELKKPITLKPLLVTFNTTYFLLLIWSYLRDKNYWESKNATRTKFRDTLNPQVLGLSLLPILAILESYNMNEKVNSLIIVLAGILFAFLMIAISWREKHSHYGLFLFVSAVYILDVFTPYMGERHI